MDVRDIASIAPILIVAGWACLLLLIDLFVPRGRKAITAMIAAAGMIVALLATVMQLGTEQEAFGGMIVIDGFAHVLMMLFLGLLPALVTLR